MNKSKNKFELKYLLATIGGVPITIAPWNSDLSTPEGVVKFVTDILNYAIGLSVVVAVIMVIVGGYTLIMSNGDPDKVSKGGKTITAAVVGMVIVFVAKLIIVYLLEKILL